MGTDTTELSLAALELDKLEACVELMFWAAYADGKVDPEERAVFEAHVQSATLGQLKAELVHAVLEHVEGSVQTADRAERLRLIAERLREPKMRRAVLALATTVAIADGKLTEDERAFLMQAGAAFEIEAGEVERLLAGAAS